MEFELDIPDRMNDIYQCALATKALHIHIRNCPELQDKVIFDPIDETDIFDVKWGT